MSQTNKDVPTIDLEPIGGGKVDVDEATNAVKTIWNLFKGSDKDGPAEDPAATPPGKSSEIGQKVVTYGTYAVGGIVLTYLIGKALE